MNHRPTPPSTARVVWLVVALHARRLWNAQFLGRSAPKSTLPGAVRGATANKRGGVGAILVFALFAVGFQSFRAASVIVVQASAVAEWSSDTVGPVGAACLERADALGEPWSAPHLPAPLDDAARTALRECLARDVARFERFDARDRSAGEETALRVDRALQRFEARGRAGFRVQAYPAPIPFPTSGAWPDDDDDRALKDVLAIVSTALVVLLVLLGLGVDREDLAKADGLVESLYQSPVTARALHVALIVRRATVNFVLWAIAFPFWLGVGVCAGHGYASIGSALVATLFIGLVAGSLQVLVETAVRLSWRPATVRNAQAIASLVGSTAYAAVMIAGASTVRPGAWSSFAPLPALFHWTPAAILVGLYFPADLPRAALGMIGWSVVIAAGALVGVERMLRRGLVGESGNLTGTRGRSTPRSWSSGGLGGVTGKDLRLLSRDRNLLAQALITPLLIVGMQAVAGRGVFTSMRANFAAGAAAAFFFATYGYAFGAANILAFEGPSLWMLYTLPRPIHRLLLDKVTLWAALGLSLALGVMVFAGVRAAAGPAHAIAAFDALRIAVALAGVVVYAFIAAGIGVLATDPNSTLPSRRQRPATIMLYLALLGGFTRTIYGDGVWDKIVALVLATVLALALWQKVRDRLPYLLDPSEAPPPSIAISDAVVATVAYFFLQTVVALIGLAVDLPLEPALTIGSAVAGSVVAASALWIFRAANVPNLLEELGLRRGDARPQTRVPWIVVSASLGGAAALCALAYRQLVLHSPLFHELLEEARTAAAGRTVDRAWMTVFAVVVAPVVEELLFRGLLFRALRRSWAPVPATLASAALFAICHPPLAVAPVFVFGCAAAIAFETTGLLWTSMLAHALYNAIVLYGG